MRRRADERSGAQRCAGLRERRGRSSLSVDLLLVTGEPLPEGLELRHGDAVARLRERARRLHASMTPAQYSYALRGEAGDAELLRVGEVVAKVGDVLDVVAREHVGHARVQPLLERAHRRAAGRVDWGRGNRTAGEPKVACGAGEAEAAVDHREGGVRAPEVVRALHLLAHLQPVRRASRA
eukprot:1421173-Prymnesium_polylepis.3